MLSKGDGTFKDAQFFSSDGKFSLGIAVADVDNDGWDDLVVSHADSNNVSVLLNDTIWETKKLLLTPLPMPRTLKRKTDIFPLD